jgi:phosphoribosylformimino-5-aminoimidazole carboxamide ribonucleotide (ProFAR) isomerase
MRFIEPPAPRGFELIPSLAVMGSTPVWVKDDRYSPIRIDGSSVSVERLVKELSDEFGALHYLDILGIRRGVVEWELFRSAVEKGGNIWADVGVVFSEGLIDVIMAGAQVVVVSTKMIDSLEEIVSSFELTENLFLQIDYDRSILSKDKNIRNMSPGELIKEMASFGMENFILDDIREGRERIDRKFLQDVVRHLPSGGSVYAGIEDLDEIEDLAGSGISGAIISCSKLMEGVS